MDTEKRCFIELEDQYATQEIQSRVQAWGGEDDPGARGECRAGVPRSGSAPDVLRKWVNDVGSDPVAAFPGHGQVKPEQLEITRLRRELAKLKAERDVLKKSRGLLREGLTARFAFIAKHRDIWPVSWICEAPGVSRSGFHAWAHACAICPCP